MKTMRFCRKCQDRMPDDQRGPYCADCVGASQQLRAKKMERDRFPCSLCGAQQRFDEVGTLCHTCRLRERAARGARLRRHARQALA